MVTPAGRSGAEPSVYLLDYNGAAATLPCMKTAPWKIRLAVIALPLAVSGSEVVPSAAAAEAGAHCVAYAMDVDAEVELFQRPPARLNASGAADAAPVIASGTLYDVTLASQADVRYPAPPAKRKPDPARTGGLVALVVPETGRYRVAVNAPVWIDAVVGDTPLEALDFRSDRTCAGPTKIVTFQLPAGARVLLQFIDVDRAALRLAVTPVPQPVW